ncbi:MAG: hypothetical protein LBV12_10955 [Puniceicoccales bacterium]|nr:hypothetical protein [Puniceicoccales bacterium]
MSIKPAKPEFSCCLGILVLVWCYITSNPHQNMLPNDKAIGNHPNIKPTVQPSAGQFERGLIKLFAKYPPHNNYVCSYEVFVESDIFKPDPGRSAMVYFSGDTSFERSYFDYGRFCFFLPKSVQPIFDEALTNKSLVLSVQFPIEANRPSKDQVEAIFRLQTRDSVKA